LLQHGSQNSKFHNSYWLLSGIMLLGSSLMLWGAEAATPEPPSPAEDGTLPALTAIAGQGMMQSHAYEELQELADQIGGRVTGSPQAALAVQWGVATMRALGLQNVRAEKWMMKRGWTRVSATARLTLPVHRNLTISSMGWTGSTPAGGSEAEVVPVNDFQLDQEMKDNSAKWAGKILLVIQRGEPSKDREQRFIKFGEFLKAAYSAHALAVIGGQGGSRAEGMHLTHTGILGYETLFDVPVVSITAEDQALIERFLDQHKSVRIRMDVQNKVTDGPVESANVVGDIPGVEHPEQIVIVSGHLDSWDLSDGATDDGTGVATTLGAAEAVLKSGFKPRRTLRFVLFTGEEQGLLGSLAYTRMHKSEMPDHVAAIVLDDGQGPVVKLTLGGRKDLVPAVKKFVDSIKAFGEVTVDDGVVFEEDSGSFTLEGLPGISALQDSPEYRYTHHSEVDTLDKVKDSILIQDATVLALTGFWIADRPERLASPWTPEQTAKMLIERHEDTELKALGMWPFGNLGEPQKPVGKN